jgi:hypothetical protein
MNPRLRKGYRVVAVFLLFAIVQIGMQIGFAAPTSPSPNMAALPQQFIARLTTRNNQPITVNGNPAATGTAIVTGATIETGADQSATVNLGPLGTLDIAPNTKLVLTYDEQGNVKAVLVVGCLILTAKKKTTGEVATEQTGSAGKTDPAKGGIIDICFPPGAAAPIVGQGAAAAAGAGAGGAAAGAAAAGGGGLFGLGTAGTIAIFAGIGGVIALIPAFQSNPSGV